MLSSALQNNHPRFLHVRSTFARRAIRDRAYRSLSTPVAICLFVSVGVIKGLIKDNAVSVGLATRWLRAKGGS